MVSVDVWSQEKLIQRHFRQPKNENLIPTIIALTNEIHEISNALREKIYPML